MKEHLGIVREDDTYCINMNEWRSNQTGWGRRGPAGALIALAAFLSLATGAFSKILNEKITTPNHEYDIKYWCRDNSNTNWFTSDGDAQDIADHFDPASGTGIHAAHDSLGFREPPPSQRDVKLEPYTDDQGDSAAAASDQRIVLPPLLINELGSATTEMLGLLAHEGHHIHQYQY